eukprot:6399204-Prymnesium_polylepis.1
MPREAPERVPVAAHDDAYYRSYPARSRADRQVEFEAFADKQGCRITGFEGAECIYYASVKLEKLLKEKVPAAPSEFVRQQSLVKVPLAVKGVSNSVNSAITAKEAQLPELVKQAECVGRDLGRHNPRAVGREAHR